MLSRIVTSLLLFVAGVLIGTIGTIAHQLTAKLAGVSLPWGLTLALLAYAALLIGLRLLSRGRIDTLAAALGSIAIILLFTQKSAGGSVLILNDALGQVWLVAPFILATVVLAWPDLSTHRRAASAVGRSETA